MDIDVLNGRLSEFPKAHLAKFVDFLGTRIKTLNKVANLI